MTGKERQRALAREKVQRQMQRRAAQAQRRRRTRNALAGVLAVVVVLGVGAYLVISFNVFGGNTGKDTLAQAQGHKSPQAQSSAAPTPSGGPSAQPAVGQCRYTKPPAGQGGPVARKVKPPSTTAVPRSGTATVVLHTNRGSIELALDQKSTPCTTHNFVSLAKQGYFNNTTCHRLSTTDPYVLQCGDPTGTGAGGPGYVFPDENLGALKSKSSGGAYTYPVGAVAMANTGQPGTNGSQFFIVYRPSPLPPAYTLFGHVTSGLDAVQKVAKAGVQGGGSDGKPKESVKIISVAVQSTGGGS